MFLPDQPDARLHHHRHRCAFQSLAEGRLICCASRAEDAWLRVCGTFVPPLGFVVEVRPEHPAG
jgi:hypothetical protein